MNAYYALTFKKECFSNIYIVYWDGAFIVRNWLMHTYASLVGSISLKRVLNYILAEPQ